MKRVIAILLVFASGLYSEATSQTVGSIHGRSVSVIQEGHDAELRLKMQKLAMPILRGTQPYIISVGYSFSEIWTVALRLSNGITTPTQNFNM